MIGGGRYVQVTFESDLADDVQVRIPASQFASVVHTLQLLAGELGGQKPATRFVGTGKSLAVDGFRLLHEPSQDLVLTVFARIFEEDAERHVKIPFTLAPQEAQSLKEKLEHYFSADI
jgi:hypothetical protein